MQNQTNSRANILIFILFLAIFIGMEVMALTMNSHYKYDIPMCIILLAFVYFFRDKIYLIPTHYFLYSVFLLIHCLGMFDFYSLYIFKIEYDYWVHGYFGFISILIIINLLKNFGHNLSKLIINFMAVIIILGISAIHELYEFAGALLLGEGEGVLFIGAGDLDPWDTQKDMLNNLLGGLLGLAFSIISIKTS